MSSITLKANYEDYTDGRGRGRRLILILAYSLFFISLSQQTLGTSFGVLVCVLLLILAICFAGHLQVSVLSLTSTFNI